MNDAEILQFAEEIDGALDLGTVFGYGDAEFDFGNGILHVQRDCAGYSSTLVMNGKSVYDGIGANSADIVNGLLVSGYLQPKCSACNDDHVHYLKDQMGHMMKAKDKNENDKENGSDAKIFQGMTPKNKGNDEDFIDDVSAEDFATMSKPEKEIVRKLMEKHDSPQSPQISVYPDGGYEVRIFGADGLYYYYFLTEDQDILHLAIMAKSEKTMEKSFANPVYITEDDYETAPYANHLTDKVKSAILKMAQSLGHSEVYSITNNDDGTYKVIFGVHSTINPYEISRKVGYNVDRDGNFTATDNEVTIMKSGFKDYKFTPSLEDLHKGKNKSFNITDLGEKKDTTLVSDKFYKNLSINDVLENRKKDVLQAQVNAVRNRSNKIVNW